MNSVLDINNHQCSHTVYKAYSYLTLLLFNVLSDIPSPSSSMVTVAAVVGVMVLGLVADTVTVKDSSPSSNVSPSIVMVIFWHTVAPTVDVEGMMSTSDSGWKSLASAECTRSFAIIQYNILTYLSPVYLPSCGKKSTFI